MNVCVEYLYRDAANYKSWGEVIFRNDQLLDLAKIEAQIRSSLIDSEFFIAEKVEVPVLYFAEHDEQLDHQWHEYSAVSVSTDPVTDDNKRDVCEFIAKLKATKKEPFL